MKEAAGAPPSNPASGILRFGSFEADTRSGQLRRGRANVKLSGQPFDVLVALLEKSGEVVTRDELREKLWPRDTFVDFEHGLNTAINKVREALGDKADNPRFIETLPRRGYRFLVPVTLPALSSAAVDNGAVPAAIAPVPSHKSRARLYFGVATAVAIVLALGSAAWYISRPLPPLRVLSYTQMTHDGAHKLVAGTDGVRLYFARTNNGTDPIGEMPVQGGEQTSVPAPLPQAVIFDVLRDGSLLVGSNDGTNFSLWRMQVPGGTLRHIAGMDLLRFVNGGGASPDGRTIALITIKGDLILMDGDGSHVRTLVSPPKEIPGGDVAWSPDGRKLRFTWNQRYWEVAADGSGLHSIRPNWHPDAWECCGRWTPDGKFFVLESRDPSINLPFQYGQLWAFDERPRTFRVSMGDPIQLTTGPMLWLGIVPGRDDREIFAEGLVLRGELVRFDASSKSLQPLWHGISAEFVEYSPDGKSVVYVTYPQGVMWRANRDGSSAVQLTGPPVHPINPRWSPDGSRIIYFTIGYGEPRRAYVVPAEGGDSVEISAANLQTDIVDPTWSSDGKSIAFARGAEENPPYADVEILDLASRQATKVAGSAGMWSPRWSPDGRYIAAQDPAKSLMIFDFKTQKWARLEKGQCDFPVWSRDSHYLYFVRLSEDAGVFRVPVAGAKPEKLLDLSGFSHTGAVSAWFGIDPDGTPLLLRDAGSDEIYSLMLSQE
jgi:DNA-binding winged helix-turn-helix (wHTH) protein/WD40 repeat protein